MKAWVRLFGCSGVPSSWVTTWWSAVTRIPESEQSLRLLEAMPAQLLDHHFRQGESAGAA